LDPISRLTREHATLLAMGHALEVYGAGVARGRWTREEDLRDFVAFFRSFVCGLRMAEEELLLDAMVRSGFAKGSGPIAAARCAGCEGGRLFNRLALLAESVNAWTDEQRNTVANTSWDYARLLRGHVHRAEGVLFPLARLRLMQHVVRELEAALGRLEIEHFGERGRARLERTAHGLVARYAALSDPVVALPASA
jgi:hemerythrin-like domain-containing protein